MLGRKEYSTVFGSGVLCRASARRRLKEVA